MNNEYLKAYVRKFGYKSFEPPKTDKSLHVKHTSLGFVSIENVKKSKYVKFCLNEKVKTFKKSDLLLRVIENIPIGWEVENEE